MEEEKKEAGRLIKAFLFKSEYYTAKKSAIFCVNEMLKLTDKMGDRYFLNDVIKEIQNYE